MSDTLANIEEKKEVKQLSTNAAKALAYAEALDITDATVRDRATKAVVQIRDQKQAGDRMRKFFTEPLNEQVKKINTLFMPTVKLFEEAEQIIRRKLGAFQAEQERIADAARAKVEADLAKGKIKNVETAVKKIEKIVEPEKTQRTAESTTTYRDVPRVVIVDEALLPREFLMPDLRKIETVAVAYFKAGTKQIPGIEIKVEKVPSFRKN